MSKVFIAACLLFCCVTVRPTIAQVAPGVQQSAAQTASVTGMVTQADGTPIANADVRLTGPATLATKSDARGTFYIANVPYGTYHIIAYIANLGTASRDDVIVKGDITLAIQYVTQANSGLKTIAQVSTRSTGARINVTQASIASVNPSEYAFQGNGTWRELLNQIPGVTVGGNLLGGDSTVNAIPDSPFQPIVLSINGALPYETSVTLDGMPVTNATFAGSPGNGTDLSFLPMPMFDTADIVRGPGANAPSIVDSIGGSFVLHAPGSIDKDQYEFSISNDPYGGVLANARAAMQLGRLSAIVVYGVNNSPGPLTGNITSALTFTPNTINGQAFLGCTPPSSCSNLIQNTPTYQNCYCLVQDSLLIGNVPTGTAWIQHNGSVALTYHITSSISAQVFYVGSSAVIQEPLAGFPVNFTPASGYAGSISPGAYNLIDAEETPLTDAQASSLLEEKITAYIGRGVLRLGALQNNSFTHELLPHFFSDGQYTLYGTGYYASAPSTQVNFNGVSAFLTFTPFSESITSWTNNRDLLASYETQLGTLSTLGFSYVTSSYNTPSECAFTFGGFGFASSVPPAVTQRTDEFRVHASTRLADRFDLDASWYFALGTYHVLNPSDPTGNTYADSTFRYNAPRIGVAWHLNHNAVIRAAAGGGFALPPLYYLAGSNQMTPTCTTTCSITLTNLHLAPETSFGFDLGTDVRMHRDTVLSFDLYRTNLNGQFFNSANLTGTYTGLPLYTTEYGNLSQSRLEGINVDIRHETPRGFYWHGALGLTRAYVVSLPAGFYNKNGLPCDTTTGVNCANTYIVPGINFDGEFQSTVPYANGTAQIGYRWAPGKYVDLSPTYYGNNNPFFQPAFIELDAHAGYPLTKNVSLLATFRNITGIHGQNFEYLNPSMGAPTVAGLLNPLFALPYGPRAITLTLNLNGP